MDFRCVRSYHRQSSYLDIQLSKCLYEQESNTHMNKSRSRAEGRKRADGRRALLVYLRPGVIKRLKMAALEQDRPAYELTEKAVCEWLADRSKGHKSRR